ncbi:MAG: DUF805 domain-containing protein [Acidimicrobiia bacterium]|nr:DUF805 domain-containing protein [Acidimicrobiia bacterium]
MPTKSPIDYWKSVVFDSYSEFRGRARRAEYWWFALVNAGIGIGLLIVAAVLSSISDTLGVLVYVLYFLFLVAIIVPSIAVLVRRLHDTGKSGWFYWFILIPLVGWIIVLVFLLTDGDRTENEYGPSPKYGMGGPDAA